LTIELDAFLVQPLLAEPEKFVVRFTDESTTQVKTAGIADIFPWGGKIKAILEDSAEFKLQFEDDSTIRVELADPGASVAVRVKNNEVEHLG